MQISPLLMHRQTKATIGGLKVTTANGWFAAGPSGTKDIYKTYAESFLGKHHLKQINEEAEVIANDALETKEDKR